MSLNRRGFLKKASGLAAAGLGFPTIVSSKALGLNGAVPASERIRIGCVGVGGMGTGNMKSFLGHKDAHIVSVCDVDKVNLEKACNTVNQTYGNSDCKTYHDFRELIHSGEVDAISMATPDHWHAAVCCEAAKAGLDIYGEKPFTRFLKEGRVLCDTVKKYGRIWQTGSWQRSVENFHHVSELVRNGRIGEVKKVEVYLPMGGGFGTPEPVQPPEGLDWDFWLGPAPYSPYREGIVHFNWRWKMDYGGGQILDWIGHHGDIAHWALGLERTGPVEVTGQGTFPKDGMYDTPIRYDCTCRYKNGVEMNVLSRQVFGVKFYGDEGWLFVNRATSDASDPKILNDKIGPNEIRLYKSRDHHQNFLDCVKSRRETIAPAEIAHRSASIGHLCLISILAGRTIRWDPDTEQIIGDAESQRLLQRPYRAPWSV